MIKKPLPIVITLILVPLLYLSAVRLVSQVIVSTDRSSLFPTALSSILMLPRSFNLAPVPLTASQLKTQHSKLNALLTLVALDPFNSEYQYLIARGLAGIEPFKAEQAALKALRLSMIDAKNWLLVGWIEGMKGDVQRGYGAFDKAVMLDPRRPDSYVQQGLYLYQAGLAAGGRDKSLYHLLAMLSLKTGLEADSKLYWDPYVSVAAASLYQESGYPGNAIRILTATPDESLSWPVAVRKIVMLCEMGEAVKALYTWKKLFVPGCVPPEDLAYVEREIRKGELPESAYFLAQIHMERGQYQEALRELTSLTARRGGTAEYKVVLASVHERMSNHAEAWRLYEEALRLSPANQEAKKKVMEYYARYSK